MHTSDTDKVQYDIPVDPVPYAWSAVREYERLHPKSLRQRLGATTRNAWASCLQTSTSERASHALAYATRPAVKDLVESRPPPDPEMRNGIASVGARGIPAAIFTFHGMYTLQVWLVSPPPQRSRLHD